MKRKLNSQRGKKSRSRSHAAVPSGARNRRRNAQGQSLGIDRPEDTEIARSPKDMERSQESYGFTESGTWKKDTTNRNRPASEGDVENETPESSETSMDVTEKSQDPYSEEEGRPDQIAEGKGRETEEMSADRLAGAEPEVEPSDIEEGDEERRGGVIKPDNDEEELRKRRQGGRGKFESNRPE
jgi:hypothetical protein